ncbi:MAG: class I adenylate-forming enzyme family protein [Henriciella sp.]|jgi:acyl-CoA synthetase (AMP-forming)/AMP-acid ligase II
MTFATAAEAVQHIVTTEDMFALEETDIRGVSFRTFKNAPRHLGEILALTKEYDGLEFLVFEDERYTYEQFREQTYRLSQALIHEAGLKKGDRVAIAMRNYPEYLMLMMAISAAGGVIVFLNSWWTTDEMEYGFTDSQAKLAFVDAPRSAAMQPFAEKMGIRRIMVRDASTEGTTAFSDLMAASPSSEAPAVEIHTDDDMAVMYTSGSTGHPKGVVQTHRGAISAVLSWLMGGRLAEVMGTAPEPPLGDDGEPLQVCGLITTPMFHVSATHACFLVGLASGAKLVMMYKWNAMEAVDLIEREKATRFFGVPTMSADLMEAAANMGKALSTLRSMEAGGAKRPAAQVGKLAKAIPNAQPSTGFGMTETNALGIGIRGQDYIDRPGAAGRLYPPLQDMQIVDDNGHEVPNGTVGELIIKSAANMRCYLNKPEATASALKEGWLYTGDLATVDDEGIVTIVDRKKDMIIRGGENISCLEVDAAIHLHPAVAEAAVFSMPHERLGEVVGAGVALKPGADVSEVDLQSFLKEQLSSFKVPERIWFRTDPLPRGGTEKTDRRALRIECLGAEAGASLVTS